MGQKVSPVGMRVGINRDWHSRWFASNKDYAKFLHEDIKVRKYLEKELKEALLSHVEIERHKTHEGYDVTIQVHVARPGVVIGQEGANINRIKGQVSKLLKGSNVRLDVINITNPDLDAGLVAQWIATELENRASFRTAQKKAIQRVRKAGAKGCKTMVSGRLGGADIARSEGYKEGIVPLTTLRSDIDFAIREAVTPYGRLGVKVWICKPAESEKKEASEPRRAPARPVKGER